MPSVACRMVGRIPLEAGLRLEYAAKRTIEVGQGGVAGWRLQPLPGSKAFEVGKRSGRVGLSEFPISDALLREGGYMPGRLVQHLVCRRNRVVVMAEPE